MEEIRIPIILVDSARWTTMPYVVFEGEDIKDMIPSEWVSEALDEAHEYDDEVTYDQQLDAMVDDFVFENSRIDEVWSDYKIFRAGYYYQYTNDGQVGPPLDEDEALELMPTVAAAKVQEWEAEQAEISSAEAITPRQAGEIGRFGCNDEERAELADDSSFLRRWKGRLYVYEAQLREAAQWRLLQPQPHMPTGTLRRPKCA